MILLVIGDHVRTGIMDNKLRIGIAGLGVVGATLARMIAQSTDEMLDCGPTGIFADRVGEFTLAGLCARDRTKDRGFDASLIEWFDDPVALARSDKIDVFVELIGGEAGPAAEAVRAALNTGKHVVTANKALLATHGRDLALLAEENGVSIGFEAAVAGAVPIISAMKNIMAPTVVSRVVGILNGTCNYILSEMESTGAEFSVALGAAQEKGFAEADPALDIQGDDAAHKLALIAAIAYGVWPGGVFAGDNTSRQRLFVQGIEHLGARDIQLAEKFGYRIRLLGVAEPIAGADDHALGFSVEPFMVRADDAFAQATGPANQIAIEGAPIGRICLSGPGAGGGPTASAVAADLLGLLNTRSGPVFGRPARHIIPITLARQTTQMARYYFRVSGVRDLACMREALDVLAVSKNVSQGGEWAGVTGQISLKTREKAIHMFEEYGGSVTTVRIAEF